MPRSTIEERLRSAKSNDPQREQVLNAIFQEAGCKGKDLTEQKLKHQPVPNLICTMTGSTDSTIIVAGHTDHVNAGEGVVDDWTGAALLPSLFQSLSKKPRKHTFVFIGFTNEEDGMVGSRFYVKTLSPEQAGKVRGMVNLECLGLTPTKVWSHHADPNLLEDLGNVAYSLHFPIATVNVEEVGDDDADSFRARGIPTITIHSVTQETITILHSRRDNFSAINWDDYYESYRLIGIYLAYLDEVLGR